MTRKPGKESWLNLKGITLGVAVYPERLQGWVNEAWGVSRRWGNNWPGSLRQTGLPEPRLKIQLSYLNT